MVRKLTSYITCVHVGSRSTHPQSLLYVFSLTFSLGFSTLSQTWAFPWEWWVHCLEKKKQKSYWSSMRHVGHVIYSIQCALVSVVTRNMEATLSARESSRQRSKGNDRPLHRPKRIERFNLVPGNIIFWSSACMNTCTHKMFSRVPTEVNARISWLPWLRITASAVAFWFKYAHA